MLLICMYTQVFDDSVDHKYDDVLKIVIMPSIIFKNPNILTSLTFLF